MRCRIFTIVVPLLVVLLLTAVPTRSQADERCFAEVEYCIAGRIRQFWEQNGGLPVFGFPISPQQQEVVEGEPYQVQWFERNRLELHPENNPPYDVLLGRLGVDLLEAQGRNWFAFPTATPEPGCIFFEETQQNACGDILELWQSNGLEIDGQAGTTYEESLALFGLPVSSLLTEVIEGQEFQVQWFERARFELHPENDPPYHVLLGLLGNEIRQVVPATPVAPTPQPAATPQPAPPGGTGDSRIVAQLAFAPVPDGFSFQNYGNENNASAANQLSTADMVQMFGADKVCLIGNNASNCVLTAAARRWLEQQIAFLNFGHCEGMAVSSLRFLLEKPFKGRTNPADFQVGASTVYDLVRDGNIENYIAYYSAVQILDEIYYPAELLRVNRTPSEMLNLIILSLEEATDPYTLAIFKYEGGYLTQGHAVTPFAVEDMRDGIYRIHVYDNNFPSETRYVEIDTLTDTWRYDTTVRPGLPVNEYVGNASTQSFFVRQLSLRDSEPFTCPFCIAGLGGLAANQAATQPLWIALYGEGHLVIENSTGQRVGYDAASDQYLNEIAGVESRPFLGGLGKATSPAYRFAQASAGERYTVHLSGAPLTQQQAVDVAMSAPGIVAGFESVLLERDEEVTMALRGDGRELIFTTGPATEVPTLFMAVDTAAGGTGYLFEVGGVDAAPDTTVSVRLDLEAGLLRFSDTDGQGDEYDVRVLRINPDGSEEEYTSENVALGAEEEAALNFGDWAGESDEMEIVREERQPEPYPAP